MKGIKTLAVLVGLAAITVAANDASAYYHPRLGRFLSRDPGAGGVARAGTASPVMGDSFAPRDPMGNAQRVGSGGTAPVGGFIPRDPTESNQYADGMNLYQYVRSNPVRYRDPSGLKIDHYDCCTDAQKRAIKAAHDAAEKKLKVIKEAIDKYTYDWVLQNYVVKKNRAGGRPKHDEQTVWTNYRREMQVAIAKMQKEFRSGIGVECEDECKRGTVAYVYSIFSDIHFCPPFFRESPSEQGSTFMHELSHLAAGTEDKAFDWTRETGWFTTGGWYAMDAADDAFWFGGAVSSLYNSTDMYRSHERWIWSRIWPRARR